MTINFGKEINSLEILQYCWKTINNIVKITTINNIEMLLKKSIPEQNLGILDFSRNPCENMETEPYALEDFKNKYIKYHGNSNKQLFWKTFFKLERPIVCLEEGNKLFPIYQHNNNTSVKSYAVLLLIVLQR